jgi:hypothetical protein
MIDLLRPAHTFPSLAITALLLAVAKVSGIIDYEGMQQKKVELNPTFFYKLHLTKSNIKRFVHSCGLPYSCDWLR